MSEMVGGLGTSTQLSTTDASAREKPNLENVEQYMPSRACRSFITIINLICFGLLDFSFGLDSRKVLGLSIDQVITGRSDVPDEFVAEDQSVEIVARWMVQKIESETIKTVKRRRKCRGFSIE